MPTGGAARAVLAPYSKSLDMTGLAALGLIGVACALLRGGSFRDRTPVQLSGASLAGSLLKLRGIYTGLNMEFGHDGEWQAIDSTVAGQRYVRGDGE